MLSYSLLWLLAIILAFISIYLIQATTKLQNTVERHPEGLINRVPPGTKLPRLQGKLFDLEGNSKEYSTTKPRQVFLFVSQDCMTCHSIVSGLMLSEAANIKDLVIICNGSRRGCRRLCESLDGECEVLVEDEVSATEQFQVVAYPTAVVIEAGEIISYHYPGTAADVTSYLQLALHP